MNRKEIKRIFSFWLLLTLVFSLISPVSLNRVSAAVELKSSTIRDYVLGKVGQDYPNGYCLKFVEECYQNLGATRPYSCCASKSGNLFIRESSSSNIPIGATVYFGNCGGGPCRSCGSSYYGHVGIYVGDGCFVHATGGKVQKSAISSWANKYRGYGYCGNFSLNQDLINNKPSPVLPGTIDSSWDVPANVTASHRITTYDEWGNAESNHYIDPGDNCYVSEVYTNGFVKVQYPTPSGNRWTFAKASDFSLNRVTENVLPSVNIHAWFSADKMGGEASNVRLGENLYLCYRVETKDGKLLDPSIGNYSIKETIYYPDGSSYPFNYGKGNNNWICTQLGQWGTYRGVVEISGDYTGTVEVSYTLTRPKDIVLDTWFSKTQMGDAVSYLEKGKSYYLCYGIKCDDKDYFNKYANVDYNVTEAVYGPDGKKVYEYTYNKSDNNWIRFTATQTGNYKGITTIKGYFNASDTETCVCKDTSKPKVNSIDITTYPKKLVYTVGEPLDTSGMVVTAYYSDKTSRNVTGYKVSGSTTQAGSKYVTVSYTENGITATDRFEITVNEKKKETVTLTYEPFGGKMSQTKQTATKLQNVTLLKEKPKNSIWISFNSNGGNSTPDKVELQLEFVDWSCTRNSVVKHYKSGETFYADANYYLFANYSPAKLSYLPDVKRDGYVFEGWYLPEGTKVTTNTIFTKNYTLVAKWKKISETHKHTPGEWKTVCEATETVTGKRVLRCVKCGEIMKTETIPVLSDTDTGSTEDIPFIDDDSEDETFLVGDEITTDNEIYTITQTGNNPTVEYTERFDEDSTEAVIPEEITIDGVTYKVTSIAPKAFYKNTSIKQVTITSLI